MDFDEEAYMMEIIRRIESEYKQAIKPYVDRLVEIRAGKMPPPYIIMSQEEFARAQKFLNSDASPPAS